MPGEPVQEGVEVGAGEFPLERLGGCVVPLLEGQYLAGEGAEVGEVVGDEQLALDDGEVDLDPAGHGRLIEVWFSLAERQAIHRGSYRSVRELNAKIRAYIDGWNDRAHPFVWTKTADEILKKANRKNTSNARH